MKLGIDLGSSTAKVVILNDKYNLEFKKYERHNGKVKETIINTLTELKNKYPNTRFDILMTGSAGMGLASRINIPFEQEVIALTTAIRKFFPEASTFIELGGEDAKIVLFRAGASPEMKMNGQCAGGTGSFIDQMATLLNIDLITLNDLASESTKKLYIASRCGVFAKTDVQALLNKGENKEDIARAVFNAVANQTITTLLAGAEIKSKILFAGGPLTFLPELRKAFIETIKLPEKDFILPNDSEVLVAVGAAVDADNKGKERTLEQLLFDLKHENKGIQTIRTLEPLFNSEKEYETFKKRHEKLTIEKLTSEEIKNVKEMYLGIDAGSTTTKMILISEDKKIIDSFYSNNNGDPLEIAKLGLRKFKKYLKSGKLKGAFATGYGEEFLEIALNLDGGIVETMAHFTAGSLFNKNISFIVDVGGQDIKAIKVHNGVITDIQLNEACSSGTGSFIETFAKGLNMTLNDFVQQALHAEKSVDLGTRCSVFMNSKVKEALKDGVPVSDIAAGLAFSVVKNALYKVIKIKNTDELGDNIFVQGGTFKNDAVLRAFELLVNKNVYRLNISEYMGAFGAALYAKDFYKNNPSYVTKFNIDALEHITFKKKMLHCNGCGNHCAITQFKFSNNNKFYTGNKCEKYFSNKGTATTIKENFFRDKKEIIFNVDSYLDKNELPEISENKPVIGIPK
ncbi:Activator of (R)-2-hydroxyglutaryl-CoA dehydratase, partial [hydrothermal vent metagenome]